MNSAQANRCEQGGEREKPEQTHVAHWADWADTGTMTVCYPSKITETKELCCHGPPGCPTSPLPLVFLSFSICLCCVGALTTPCVLEADLLPTPARLGTPGYLR